MEKLILFGILSVLVVLISWRTLFNPRSHGFYRFFSWECMAWLVASNYSYWFKDPLSIQQVISWILLLYAAYLAIAGLILIKKIGKPDPVRDEKNLFGFEKTTGLIDTGVFKHIRHPLYASLILISWAVYLKKPCSPAFLNSLAIDQFPVFHLKV